jgi:hypothetical protein
MHLPSSQTIQLANRRPSRFASASAIFKTGGSTRFFSRLIRTNLIGLALGLQFCSPVSLFAQPTFSAAAANSVERIGVIKDDDVPESSGLARSALFESFWTLNDSANPARIYLFRDSGKLLAKPKLKNAKNVDWESMSSFTFESKPWLVVADVGDNQRIRKSYQLYLAVDPTAGWQDESDKKLKKHLKKLDSIETLRLEFHYEPPAADTSAAKTQPQDSVVAKDCEAIAVDPITKDVWLVEKVYLNRDRSIKPGIFRIRLPRPTLQQFVAELEGQGGAAHATVSEFIGPLLAKRIGSFPVRNVTGMAFSPDGKKLIIRNYLTAHLYVRPPEKNWQQTINETKPKVVGIPLQGQGEAVCFTADSKSLVVTSEGKRQPIWRVSLDSYLSE